MHDTWRVWGLIWTHIASGPLHLLGFTSVCVAALAFFPLLALMALKGRDAVSLYNMHQRKLGREELPTGYLLGGHAASYLLSCTLPADMDEKVVRAVQSAKLWATLFFVNLLYIALVASWVF